MSEHNEANLMLSCDYHTEPGDVDPSLRDIYGPSGELVIEGIDGEIGDRIVSCVNALAGIEDPAEFME